MTRRRPAWRAVALWCATGVMWPAAPPAALGATPQPQQSEFPYPPDAESPLLLPVTAPEASKPPSLRRPCATVDPDLTDARRRERADAHAVRADDLFTHGDTAGALAEIDKAQCYWPHPDYDFMRGVLFASRGECAKARAAMREFFGSEPNDVDARAARERIGACGPVPPPAARDLPDGPAVPPAMLFGPEPPPRTEDRPLDAAERRRVLRDPLAAALLGGGGTAIVIGTALTIAAGDDDSHSARTFAEFQDLERSKRRLRAAGGTLLGLGSAAIVGAIVRYALRVRQQKRDRARSRGVARRSVTGP